MKTKIAFVMVPALALALGSAASAQTIYDNGGPDGSNGLSNIRWDDLPLDRFVADDFVIAGGPGWLVDGVTISYLWNSGAGLGQSLGFRVIIYADDAAGGGPGSVISDQTVALGSEFLTGVEYFGRPEVVFSVDIAPVALDADTTYWVAMQPQGIENGFQLTSGIDNLIGDQVWVLYPDLSGPDYVPGFDIFGLLYDASFSLQGEVIPAPGAMALLAFAGLVGARRRRRK